MFYPALDKLIPKTKKQIFFVDNSIFLYTLNREDKKTFFPLLEKMFSCPPYSKWIKKLSNFHLHQQKIFWYLVFGFSLSNEQNIGLDLSQQQGLHSKLFHILGIISQKLWFLFTNLLFTFVISAFNFNTSKYFSSICMPG